MLAWCIIDTCATLATGLNPLVSEGVFWFVKLMAACAMDIGVIFSIACLYENRKHRKDASK